MMVDRVDGACPRPACWVCGSSRSTAFKAGSLNRPLSSGDLRITDANYGCTLALRRCGDCGFISADRADLATLIHLYEELDDPGYEESQQSRALQMSWLLDLAKRSRPGIRSALDVGAASGLLVKLARKRGWRAEGVEPSEKLVATARRCHGVELLQGQMPHPSLKGQRFDAVFLVDVIEHVPNPLELLDAAAAALADGGVLVVVTPDVSSRASRLLGSRWWHFRLAHVGYFDQSSFAEASRRSGLAIERSVRAKWFFPVSYLVERVAHYLPVGDVARLLKATRWGARAGSCVVPLNLHDSWVFICRASPGDAPLQPAA